MTCGWAPDGRHFLTATTAPRLRVDNALYVYKYNGLLLHKQDFFMLLEATWVPAPAGDERGPLWIAAQHRTADHAVLDVTRSPLNFTCFVSHQASHLPYPALWVLSKLPPSSGLMQAFAAVNTPSLRTAKVRAALDAGT